MSVIKFNEMEYFKFSDITTENMHSYLIEQYQTLFPEWSKINNAITKTPNFNSTTKLNIRQKEEIQAYFMQSINNAEKDIHIISGTFNPSIYNKELIETFEKSLEKGIKYTIISGKTIIANNGKNLFIDQFILPNIHKDKLNYSVYNNYPEFHSWIIDDKTVTFEYPHLEFQSKRKKFLIKDKAIATIIKDYYHNKTLKIDNHNIKYLVKKVELSDLLKAS